MPVSKGGGTERAVHSARTLAKRRRELQRIDELGVETRGHLHAHTAKEEPEVEHSEVGLFVPWCLVVGHQARDDGVGSDGTLVENGHSADSSSWSSRLLLADRMSGWYRRSNENSRAREAADSASICKRARRARPGRIAAPCRLPRCSYMMPPYSAHSRESTTTMSFSRPLSACQELWPRHFSVRSTVTPWALVDHCNLTGWVNCKAARQPTPHLGTPGGRMEMADVVSGPAQSPLHHDRRWQKCSEHLWQSWRLDSRRVPTLAGLGDGNELRWLWMA